jgi:hypothetical protein
MNKENSGIDVLDANSDRRGAKKSAKKHRVPGVKHYPDRNLTINVPLIWKVREIIFFSGQNS